MYKDLVLLRSVNLLTKVIGLILWMAMIVATDNLWYLCLLNLFLLFFAKRQRGICYLSVGALVLNCFSFFFPQLLWITKIINIVVYAWCIMGTISFDQVQEFLEHNLYALNNGKYLDHILSLFYRFKGMKTAWNQLENLRKSYGQKMTLATFYKNSKMAYQMSKYEYQQIKYLYQIRLFHLYREKSWMEESQLEVWDYHFLFFHFVLLILSFAMGGII